MGGMAPSLIKGKVSRGEQKEEKLRLEVVMNLICILIPVLLVQQVVDYFRHDVELPVNSAASSSAASSEEPEEKKEKPFNLKLTIGEDGSFLIVNVRALKAGQDGLVPFAPGLLLAPKPDGSPNYDQLRAVLAKEKKQRLGGKPATSFTDPDQITISAPSTLDYQRVMRTLDYVRFAPVKPGQDMADAPGLFTLISLSPGSVRAG